MSEKRNARMRRGKHVIRHYCRKAGCALHVESFLELWFLCSMELNNKVANICSQPESMNLRIDGKPSRFTPDFLIEYTDGSYEYVEIHHLDFVSPVYLNKIKQFDLYTRQTLGVSIRLITHDSVNVTELTNFQLIVNAASSELSFTLDDIDFAPATLFGDLIDDLTEFSQSPIADAYALLAQGVYQFDSNALLTRSSPLVRGLN